MDALLPALYFGQPIVGLSRALRSRARARADRALRGAQLVPVPHRAQDDDEGAPAAEASASTSNLRSIMSAGEAVGTTVLRLGARGARRDHQRDVRPDRDELHRRQLARSCGRRSPGRWDGRIPGHRIAAIDDDGQAGRGSGRGRRGRRHRIAPSTATPDPVFFLGYFKNPDGTREEVHRRLVPHRRPRATAMPTATSGIRAAPTTCSRRRATASALGDRELPGAPPGGGQRGGRARRRTRCAATSSRRSSCLRRAHVAVAASSRTRHPAARAATPRALRVSEGDRIHRRAADDHDRQGAAASVLRERERTAKEVGVSRGP